MKRKDIVFKYFNEQKDYFENRVKKGIENYRKGDAEIEFVSSGNLPENITVEIEQTNHEFKFGANIFMLDEFETVEKNEIYREKFPELFNLATLPFYWNSLEPEKGNFRFDKNSPKIYVISLLINTLSRHAKYEGTSRKVCILPNHIRFL